MCTPLSSLKFQDTILQTVTSSNSSTSAAVSFSPTLEFGIVSVMNTTLEITFNETVAQNYTMIVSSIGSSVNKNQSFTIYPGLF
jgi:hypothetical protein